MATTRSKKSQFIAFRGEDRHHVELNKIARRIGQAGNMSAALRYLIEQNAMHQPTTRPVREVGGR